MAPQRRRLHRLMGRAGPAPAEPTSRRGRNKQPLEGATSAGGYIYTARLAGANSRLPARSLTCLAGRHPGRAPKLTGLPTAYLTLFDLISILISIMVIVGPPHFSCRRRLFTQCKPSPSPPLGLHPKREALSWGRGPAPGPRLRPTRAGQAGERLRAELGGAGQSKSRELSGREMNQDPAGWIQCQIQSRASLWISGPRAGRQIGTNRRRPRAPPPGPR